VGRGSHPDGTAARPSAGRDLSAERRSRYDNSRNDERREPQIPYRPKIRPFGLCLQRAAIHHALYFARHEDCLYSFSTEGQKLEWMRFNPLVCVEADDIDAPYDWSSVIVLGSYEELPKHSEYEDARQLAFSLLSQRPAWWQPGYVKTILHGKERKLEQVYFRISISKISGHRAIPSVGESVPFDPPG
jgi:uncharacterized protein